MAHFWVGLTVGFVLGIGATVGVRFWLDVGWYNERARRREARDRAKEDRR